MNCNSNILLTVFGCYGDIMKKKYVQAINKNENNLSLQAVQKKMRDISSYLVIRRFFLIISSLNCIITESIPFKKITYIGEEDPE